jgi:hypothetical protein
VLIGTGSDCTFFAENWAQFTFFCGQHEQRQYNWYAERGLFRIANAVLVDVEGKI